MLLYLELIELKDLREELAGLSNWFHLGMILDVPETALLKILMDCRHCDPCRTQVLKMWLERRSNHEEGQQPSWSRLAGAVEAAGRESIARHIAKKYREHHHCMKMNLYIRQTHIPCICT